MKHKLKFKEMEFSSSAFTNISVDLFIHYRATFPTIEERKVMALVDLNLWCIPSATELLNVDD